MLANTIHSYSAFFIGGWIGITCSMLVEFAALWGYLRRIRSPKSIVPRFVIANLASAVAGLPISVTTYYFPSGTVRDNILSLTSGIGIAYLATVFIESAAFLFGSEPAEHRRLIRALVMSNFFSYSVLVAIHLATV
jgi:hypothetical protein